VFALMSDKSESGYRTVLEQLVDVVDFPPDNPKRIMLDFERAVWNAIADYLPMAKLSGCVFHFQQALRRKLQALGLIGLYNQSERFSYFIRIVQSLPFVPAEKVVQYFEDVALDYMKGMLEDDDFQEFKEVLTVYVTYLERTWIGVRFGRSNRRRPPLFPIPDWNHYDDALEGCCLTNNSSESFNSTWTSSLGRRPTLYTILEHFAQKDSWAEQILREDAVGVGGNALEASKNRSLQRVQRQLDLQAICRDVDNTSPDQYINRLIGVLRDY
jgi:MULE transposase domain